MDDVLSLLGQDTAGDPEIGPIATLESQPTVALPALPRARRVFNGLQAKRFARPKEPAEKQANDSVGESSQPSPDIADAPVASEESQPEPTEPNSPKDQSAPEPSESSKSEVVPDQKTVSSESSKSDVVPDQKTVSFESSKSEVRPDQSEKSSKSAQREKFVRWQPKRAPLNEGLIFISIAAYRDVELLPTIRNLLQQARFPDKLRFGICLQESTQALNDFPWYGDLRFRIQRVPADQSRGCCWARSQVQALYQGEHYYLQIDSHERFVKHWDERAIWQLHHCRSSRPILSTYLPPYCPETEQRDVELTDLYSIAITGYDKRGLISFRPQLILADELPLAEPRPAFMIAGGFIFTFGEWLTEVPYDPRLYFNGEEVSLTVRSWTHGWDVFCPNQVVAFHYYQRKDEPKHWKEHDDWRTANNASIDLVLQQLKGTSQGTSQGTSGTQRFGLGSFRTLDQYQAFAGVDFESKSISAAAKRGLVTRPMSNGYEPPAPPECYADLVAQPPLIQQREAPRPLVDTGLKPIKALLPVGASLNRDRAAVPLPRNKTAPKLITTNPKRQPLVKNLFPTPSARGRRRIDYANGYLAKDSTGAWHEYKNGQRFATFQQRRGAPDDEHILLYDATRELNLRIDGKGRCDFVQGQLRPNSQWRINFQGDWQ